MTFLVTISILLYVAYYLVAFFYFLSGIILLIRPQVIEYFIPKFFPLLASRNRGRIENGLNLVVVGLLLFLVSNLLFGANFFGFFIALVLSIWEVFLSIIFYLKYHTHFDAVIHFVPHSILVVFIGWVLLTVYPKDIDYLAQVMHIEKDQSRVSLVDFSVRSPHPKTNEYTR